MRDEPKIEGVGNDQTWSEWLRGVIRQAECVHPDLAAEAAVALKRWIAHNEAPKPWQVRRFGCFAETIAPIMMMPERAAAILKLREAYRAYIAWAGPGGDARTFIDWVNDEGECGDVRLEWSKK